MLYTFSCCITYSSHYLLNVGNLIDLWLHFSDADELKVKEETSATIRCYPFEQPEGTKKCFMTGTLAEEVAIFAKSY